MTGCVNLTALLRNQRIDSEQQDTSVTANRSPSDADIPQIKLFKDVAVEIKRIDPFACHRGEFQTREDFDEAEIDDLANNFQQTDGNHTAIFVRPRTSDSWEIIAGERRVRASQKSGHNVLANIGDFTDEQAALLCITENLQREDLNPIERANAYLKLKNKFNLTQQEVAGLVGKGRVAVANSMRLLKLHIAVQRMLANNHKLQEGHGKALLMLDDRAAQLDLAKRCANNGWSVRQLERQVNQHLKKHIKPLPDSDDVDIRKFEEIISEKLGRPIRFNHSANGSGVLQIQYFHLEDLNNALSLLGEDLSSLEELYQTENTSYSDSETDH